MSGFISAPRSRIAREDKNLVGQVTVLDGDLACGGTVSSRPANDGHVTVLLNGSAVSVGDGAMNRDCYFSGDGGATARLIKDVDQGDTLRWVGSIAGYQIAVTDRFDFLYDLD